MNRWAVRALQRTRSQFLFEFSSCLRYITKLCLPSYSQYCGGNAGCLIHVYNVWSRQSLSQLSQRKSWFQCWQTNFVAGVLVTVWVTMTKTLVATEKEPVSCLGQMSQQRTWQGKNHCSDNPSNIMSKHLCIYKWSTLIRVCSHPPPPYLTVRHTKNSYMICDSGTDTLTVSPVLWNECILLRFSLYDVLEETEALMQMSVCSENSPLQKANENQIMWSAQQLLDNQEFNSSNTIDFLLIGRIRASEVGNLDTLQGCIGRWQPVKETLADTCHTWPVFQTWVSTRRARVFGWSAIISDNSLQSNLEFQPGGVESAWKIYMGMVSCLSALWGSPKMSQFSGWPGDLRRGRGQKLGIR